jgi:hypothetical protein
MLIKRSNASNFNSSRFTTCVECIALFYRCVHYSLKHRKLLSKALSCYPSHNSLKGILSIPCWNSFPVVSIPSQQNLIVHDIDSNLEHDFSIFRYKVDQIFFYSSKKFRVDFHHFCLKIQMFIDIVVFYSLWSKQIKSNLFWLFSHLELKIWIWDR